MNLNQKTVRLSRLALFSALILLLNYTPLGYIRVFALEITLIIIPVTLGAMLLGPADGAILGGVFGLTSFATCFGSSQFGVTLLAINPIGTFITCVVARCWLAVSPAWCLSVCIARKSSAPSPMQWAVCLARCSIPCSS